jgi:catechol 2,3-dioxygenase-like lactoylglutathione lyase family enzyme
VFGTSERESAVAWAFLVMTRPDLQGISPFFIVSNVDQTIAFYRDRLGFETRFKEPDLAPFFAIIGRGEAQIMVKSDKDVSPLPNARRHPFMRWDAYVYAPDPDALAAEFADHNAAFCAPLTDTHDGLRSFEICDHDGYVLFFFGRPRQPSP